MLLAFLFAGAAAAAEGQPAFSVSTERAEPGDEVVLAVSTVNNPGIAAFLLDVDYDSKALEWTGVTMSNMGGMTSAEPGESVIWFDISNFYGDTVIFTLTFVVKDSAPSGLAEVGVSYTTGNVCNEKVENVAFAVVPGGVEVVGGAPAAAGEETPEPTQQNAGADGAEDTQPTSDRQTDGAKNGQGAAASPAGQTAPAAAGQAQPTAPAAAGQEETASEAGQTPPAASAAEDGGDAPEEGTAVSQTGEAQAGQEKGGSPVMMIVVLAAAVIVIAVLLPAFFKKRGPKGDKNDA